MTKCDDQELATMINKGKGKLKWERDMPRDIEEKLEVMIMMTMMMMVMMMVTMELIMVEIIMLRHNHFAVI